MEVTCTIEAPKTLVGTAKKKGIAVRWNMPNGLFGMVYPSGQVVKFALEKERDSNVDGFKTAKKEPAKVTLSGEDQYKLKLVHREQEIKPVVARNVRQTLGGKHWQTH